MRYVVRDQTGAYFAEFTSAADRYAEDGSTAQERALSWAALQSGRRHQFSVFREDSTPAGMNMESILVRRWPGQIIFAECLAH
jgi:hypothetical protein